MKTLRLSPDLALPLDFATEGVAIIGRRGSGKSNTEVRWAEVCHAAGIPFVAVDPKGDWHGIRSSADGKAPGLSVPVFGGLHGDFPLEASAGALVADLLVDEMLSAVLDVSRMSKTGELPRFLVAFFDRLMDRHQQDPHVRSVILEEAHRYIPQRVDSSMARLKEAASAILLEGRAWGLGCLACTQRPARLNKDVLEEVGNVVLHGLGVAATNDARTVEGWVRHYDLSAEIVASLAQLKPGEAWFLSPHLGLVTRTRMDRRKTFDSGATPTVGVASRRPATMADIDAAAIKEAMAEYIERAVAEDPKTLHKRIRELEGLLRDAQEATPEPIVVEVPVLGDQGEKALEMLCEHLRRSTVTTEACQTAVVQALGGLRDRKDLPRTGPARGGTGAVGRDRVSPQRVDPPRRREPRREAVPGPALKLAKAPKAILSALAQYGPRSRSALGILCGYAAAGGSFGNAIGSLRSAQWVEGTNEALRITDAGRAALGPVDPLPTGEALVEHWMGRLGHAEREILRVLVDAAPEGISREGMAGQTFSRKGEPYEVDGGSFGNALGKLRTLGLIEKLGGAFYAAESLVG